MLLGYPEFWQNSFTICRDEYQVWAWQGKASRQPILILFDFVRIDRGWFWGCMVVLALYFWVLFWYSKTTPMLRDAPADLTPQGIPGLACRYNATFQMPREGADGLLVFYRFGLLHFYLADN